MKMNTNKNSFDAVLSCDLGNVSGGGALLGAAIGAGAGAALSGFCGPAAPLCLTPLVIAGTAVGAVSGELLSNPRTLRRSRQTH